VSRPDRRPEVGDFLGGVESGDPMETVPAFLVEHLSRPPWEVAAETAAIVGAAINQISDDFVLVEHTHGRSAIHRSATVHPTVVATGPLIVDEGASVGPHVVLRSGAYVGHGAHIGASCEVKSAWIMAGAAVAHLAYIGNSVVCDDVNIEAGVVLANHFNERSDRMIQVVIDDTRFDTGYTKFGAIVGSGSRIGANSVTTPGTLLAPHSIVGRLTLVDQTAERSDEDHTDVRRSTS